MTGDTLPQSDPILASHQRNNDALRAGDVATIISFFSEDAIFMPPNDTTLYGRAEIAEWYEDYFEHFRIEGLTDTEREVTVLEEWAVERTSYTVAIAPKTGGERIRDDGRFLSVWKRDTDGAWRMMEVMFNSIRPIGSGTSRFISRMSARKEKDEGSEI